uniref:Uncharacterized protein n=1 Tax=Aegilops tauschii TaxID=37682 RepID=M8BP09_AEGTA
MPMVSLLQVCICNMHHKPFGFTVSKVLRAAIRLEPNEFILSFPWSKEVCFNLVRLPCFHRSTFRVLERLEFDSSEYDLIGLHTMSLSKDWPGWPLHLSPLMPDL